MLWVLIGLVASYVIGGFPTAIFAGKIVRGIDVRDYGSHNAGATNVWRVLGAGPGLTVLLIDAGKGVLCVLAVAPFAASMGGPNFPVDAGTMQVLCGVMAIVGHIWTIWAGFKGGKGVGTAAGVFGALAPWCILIALAAFALVLALSRYVSLGSITAAITLAASIAVQYFVFNALPLAVVIAGAAVATTVVVTHHGNIRRLLSGTENKFGRPASAAPEAESAGESGA